MSDAERFHQLLAWLRLVVRVCGVCALDYALGLVEREAGRPWTLDPCERSDRRGRSCRHLLELFWEERPKRPVAAPERSPVTPTSAPASRSGWSVPSSGSGLPIPRLGPTSVAAPSSASGTK